MRRALGWVILMLIVVSPRAGAYDIPYETWMGTYVGEKKAGYLSFKIDRNEYEGKPGYRIASVLNNHLVVLGTDLHQFVTTVVRTDENFKPLTEEFSMSSGGKTTKVSAVFKEKTVECIISAGSGSSTKSLPLPEGADLVGDATFALLDRSHQVGHVYAFHYFNPLTLTVDNLDVTVECRETIEVDGRKYDTFRLKNVTPMGEMTVWQEPDGDIIKVKAMMGITMIRQPKDEAMADIDAGKTSDFAVFTSVKTDAEIRAPRQIRNLTMVLHGLHDTKMVIADSRQQVSPVEGEPGSYLYVIRSDWFQEDRAAGLPIPGDEFAEYLQATPYVDFGVPAVKNQAAEIVGGETNSYRACSAIRAWIYQNLKTRSDIGITRSASDVLRSKVGVCRDYAILFAALARSVGIPSKVVAGLLYMDGAFYYHAWVECYVGQWVPFDATMTTDFVDAAHVKLAEGDAASMYALAKVMGELHIEVKDYQ